MSVIDFPGRPEGWYTELPYMEDLLQQYVIKNSIRDEFSREDKALLKEETKILEIGTYMGLTASLLSEFGRLTTVDPHPESWDSYSKWLAEANRDIKPLRMTSQQAIHELNNNTYDIIHIDGDHSYEGVKFDLENFVPLLRPGGLLLCHDYGEPSPGHDGVKIAIDEYIPEDWETGLRRRMFYAWKPDARD